MKTHTVIFWAVFSFAASGCIIRTAIPPVAKIKEAKLSLSSAHNSRAADYAPVHLDKAEEYLEKAMSASKMRNSDKALFFALLSVHESRLAITLGGERSGKERLNMEIKKMESAKAMMDKEKNSVEKIKKKLVD